MMQQMDIAAVRSRCATGIRNTALGRYLGQALDELQAMRDREATMVAGRCVSTNLIEIAMEIRDPAKWAAMMLTKGTSGLTTVGEAMDLIEGTLRHALTMMLQAEIAKCDRMRADAAEAFLSPHVTKEI